MARACPYSKPGGKEATGQRVSQMTGNERENTTSKKKTEAERHDTELFKLIENAAGMMQTLSVSQEKPKSGLGLTVTTPIQVNGVTTTALVDTGSPATIVSLEFVIRVLASARRPDQTPEQWKEATYAKFARPAVTFKSYGGQVVDITAQLGVTLTLGKQAVETPVLVQKDAPNDVLLGTDVLPQFRHFSSSGKWGR